MYSTMVNFRRKVCESQWLILQLFIISVFVIQYGLAAPPRDFLLPPMTFDIYNIKTPQLMGIIAGVTVFVVTITVVFILLYLSGSFHKLWLELQSNDPTGQPNLEKSDIVTPQFAMIPELYDHLIEARKIISKQLLTNNEFFGSKVTVRPYNEQSDCIELCQCCNGTALFGESSYEPARIWGWLDTEYAMQWKYSDRSAAEFDPNIEYWTWSSEKLFQMTFLMKIPNGRHYVIKDNELKKSIGMVSLLDNCDINLSIRIDNLWLTPAFQGKQRALDALLQLLSWLFQSGYRRVTAELDERHIIGRKFFERCEFKLEAILRKHRIIQKRNRNTALYVMLNSEWPDAEIKLKKLLNISAQAKKHKIAEVEPIVDIVGERRSISNLSQTNKEKKNKKNKKEKKPK